MLIASTIRVRSILAIAGAALSFVAHGQSQQAELPTKPFIYKADSRKLPEVLQDFAAALEIPVVVADGVDGTVNGKFNLSPRSFLDLMSSAYGLTWYFDGSVLFVYPSRANQSKVLFLRDFGADRIERLLHTLKLGDKRFPLKYDAQEKTLVVSGPPRHLELVESLVDALSERGREDGRTVVRVFPLRYASASDQTIGGSTVTGMVTMLNQVYGSSGGQAQRAGGISQNSLPTAMSPMQALYGTSPEGKALQEKQADRTDRNINSAAGVLGLGGTNANPSQRTSGKALKSATPAPAEEDRPYFTADDANNAVIVTGLPHRMTAYHDLIKQLDVVSDLIELEAMIIDVRHDDASSIGINWSAKNRSTDAAYSSVPTVTGTAGSVFQLTTLSADLSRQLLLAVNALQQQGRARVLARPRVLGVANRVATMKDTRTASVRVSGNLSSNLYSIETGTQIEVIPRRISVDGTPAIKLVLAIQDGSFDTTVVDAIPIVKRTEISTEAYVIPGEGLLIGGISTESESSGQSGLPGFSQIPVFGALFRSTEDQASRRERLFLITPRVVPLARRTSQTQPDSGTPGAASTFKMSGGISYANADRIASKSFRSKDQK